MGDSCGLRISSNSLELLLKIGIFDFLSPCFVGLGFVSGDINFARILGGFISDILGVHCSCTGSSCSLPERSLLLLNLIISNDGTSSSLTIGFSRFVRSLIDLLFSIASIASLQLSPAFSAQSFTSNLPSRKFSSFDNVLSSKFESFNGS